MAPRPPSREESGLLKQLMAPLWACLRRASPEPAVPFPPLEAGRLIRRENRFLLLVESDRSKEALRVHLGDPGRLKDILVPGVRLWIARREGPGMTTHRAVLAAPEGGSVVALVPTLAEQAAERVLNCAGEKLPEAHRFRIDRQPAVGRHRFDFRLVREDRPPLWVEVKAVTLADGPRGLFPDAVTERGRRHVQALADAVENGAEALLLFVALRSDVRSVEPAAHIDPDFAAALLLAKAAGVRMMALSTRPTLAGLYVEGILPVLL